MDKYDHKTIEAKWQRKWEENKINVVDIEKAKKPFYNLWMFPYPSAEGLHVGHAFASTAADIYGRYKKLCGYDVFQPIGYDSFGIHSENFALKIGEHPKIFTDRAIKNYERQLRAMGHMDDWSRTVTTSDPIYYKWTQWIFLQMYKAGLAYRAKANVNFCPECKTVLSDEQVIDSKCERCSTEVTKKELEQWFFRITKYADKLLKNLDKLNWTEKIKLTQKNWIGRKEGRKIRFGDIEVFTTRVDTIFGATFVILSPNHPLAGKAKTVVNPATKKEIPVFVDEYVMDSVGTGAIMGVPAYDDRDLAFARKMNLPVVKAKLTDKVFGEKMITYHLRDWLISRQRYWGPPIPMINCSECGWQPVPEKDLPVELPFIEDYQPKGAGRGPLENYPEFYRTTCPKCGGPAERETDVSDTFLDSAWYELRYPSTNFKNVPFDKKITKKWLPVNMYTGGPEHAVLHLMYFRFVAMALFDMGYLPFAEPCERFFAHGMLVKNGVKMSKSKGNVVNPDEYIAKFGADTLRLYLMFMGPVENGGDWRDTGIAGMRRWVDRVWQVINQKLENLEEGTEGMLEANKLVKKAEEDVERRHYNTTISAMMVFINGIADSNKKVGRKTLEKFLIVFSMFAPHLVEELWEKLRGKDSVHSQKWPEAGKITTESSVVVVMINGKMRATVPAGNKETVERLAKEDPRVAKYLSGNDIQKVVFVSGKVINFVL